MNRPDGALHDVRSLAAALYGMALLFVVTPLLQVATRVNWRFPVSSMQWRTGTLGLLASAVLTPAFGLLLALLTAFLFEHRRTQRVVTVLTGLASLGLLAILVLFTLDGLQIRAALTPQFRPSFTNSMIQAITLYVLTAAVLGITCFGGFRAGRHRRLQARAAKRAHRSETPLVVAPLTNPAPRS